MDLLKGLLARLRALVFPYRVTRELEEELEYHLQRDAERLVREGLSPGEARRRARLLLGGEARFVERAREAAAGSSLLDGLSLDVRSALRSVRRAPGSSTAAVVLLAAGVGGVSAVGGLAGTALLRPLDFPDPDRLVVVWRTVPSRDLERLPVPAPVAAALRDDAGSVATLAFLATPDPVVVTSGGGGTPRPVRRALVEPELLELLGVAFVRGRAPVREGEAAVSHDFWRSSLGGVWTEGIDLRVDGETVRVTGVLPGGFGIPIPSSAGIAGSAEIYQALALPLSALVREEGRLVDQDSDDRGLVVARLGAAASPAIGREALARRIRAAPGRLGYAGEFDVAVRPLSEEALVDTGPTLLALLGAAILALIVCGLGTAGILQARLARRSRDLAISRALGASSYRVLRRAGVEGGILLGAGVLGAVGTAPLVRFLIEGAVRLPPGLAAAGTGSAAAVAAGAAGVCVAAAVVAVVLVLRLPGEGATDALRSGRGAALPGPGRGVVGLEVALAYALLLCGLLLHASAREADREDLGFRTRGVLTLRLSLRELGDRYRGPAERARLMRELEESLSALPAVGAVGTGGRLPLDGRRWTRAWALPGEALEPEGSRQVEFLPVTSGLLDALDLHLIAGRGFLPEEDLHEEERVVVVDLEAARSIAPGRGAMAAVGERILIPLDGSPVVAEVVGVVGPLRHDDPRETGGGVVLVPYRQEASREVALAIFGSGDPTERIAAARDAVRRVDPDLVPYDVRTMDSYVRERLSGVRTARAGMGLVGLLAVLLTSVGVYALLSQRLSARTRELATRLALGATPLLLARSMAREGGFLLAVGILVGLPLGIGVTTLMDGLLYGVSPLHPTLLALAAMGVAIPVATALAPLVVRLRRMEPARVLREG